MKFFSSGSKVPMDRFTEKDVGMLYKVFCYCGGEWVYCGGKKSFYAATTKARLLAEEGKAAVVLRMEKSFIPVSEPVKEVSW